MAGERWFFTPEQLENTPSRKCGIDSDKETYYKQQAANFIQDMGQRLQVTQLCINTAIVYLHRFYMFHPFTKFHRNNMAEACLFLAAKVEEQPRKLEHVIKVAHMILHRDQGPLDTKGVAYLEHAQELVVNENILLQSLGFELQVDHPHTHIVKTCDLIRAAKDLAQTSYFLATNSLHLTQMSLQYKPTFVACVCIHLACKWAQFEIPRSDEGKEWFFYVDKTMTAEILEELTQNFLAILDKCPSKFKKKLMSKSAKDEDLLAMLGGPPEKKVKREAPGGATSEKTATVNNHEPKVKVEPGVNSPIVKPDQKASPAVGVKQEVTPKPGSSSSDSAMRRVRTDSCLTSLTTKEYFEKREREKQERERIERERQRMVAEKEKPSSRSTASAAGGRDKSHVTSSRQHTNIFEQMASNQIKPEAVSDTDVTDQAAQSKEKHSLDRSLVQHNYKDKYHEKERASAERSAADRPAADRAASDRPAQPRKLPFSVDHNKLRDDQRSRSTSHRHHEHRPESSREAGASSRHGHDPKYKGHRGHLDYRSQEHRPHSLQKELQRHESHRVPNPDVPVHTKPTVPEPVSKPPVEAAPAPAVDPEEGEILDDDSPLIPDPKEDIKKSHSHTHRHHSRERRSSGHRHHSPGSAVPPEREALPPSQDARVRRKSPRNGRPAKEEVAPQQHAGSSVSHPERKSSGPRHEPVSTETVVPEKAPELTNFPSKVAEVAALSQRGTPEPGEIVEHGSHKHHKSSHSKSHKRDKHRERDLLQASESSSSGSLKIKLDLKGMGKVPTPTKHGSPAAQGLPVPGEEKKKELKLKIKPPQPTVEVRDGEDSTPNSSVYSAKDIPSAYKLKEGLSLSQKLKETTPGQKVKDLPNSYKVKETSSSKVKDIQSTSHKAKDTQQSAKAAKDLPAAYKKDLGPSLKVKLKLPSSSNVSGNGETSHAKSETKDLTPGGSRVTEPKAQTLKLVLSKDSLGQYSSGSSSGSSQKPARHSGSSSADKSSSRKRAFSPSEGSLHKHKLPRNDSSSRLLPTGGDLSAAGSLSGSPSVVGQSMTPSKEHLEQTMKQLHQIIEQTQEQMMLSSQHRSSSSSHRKHRHGNPTPPRDKPYSDLPQ